MLDFSNFSLLTAWVIAHGYVIIFLVMCVEGPFTTAAAGFAAALGYFDPFAILFLSIMGDLVPDTLYYYIGYFSKTSSTKRFGERIGLTEQRVGKTETLLREHFGKTMLMLKLTPVIPTFAFMLVGALHISYRRFLWLCSVITVPKSILFLFLGYFFGQLYNVSDYLHYASVLFPAVIISGVIIYFAYSKISARLAKKISHNIGTRL
jgi:membrane protein DedA with SNARE-associated domain